jgi:glyoxylase-like metal-dependent hydrolase (beta-lactamase superfamily II)
MSDGPLPREVVTGVYLLAEDRCDLDPPHAYVYAVPHAGGLLVFDAGNGLTVDSIRAAAAAVPGGGPITHVLLTHCHVDHAIGAPALQAGGALIGAHANAAAAMARDVRQMWYEHPDRVKPIHVDLVFQDGDRLDIGGLQVRVIHTPGHTSGCVCYLLTVAGRRCLVIGDLTMCAGLPGWKGSCDYDAQTLRHSQAKALETPFDVMLGGHFIWLEGGHACLAMALRREAPSP